MNTMERPATASPVPKTPDEMLDAMRMGKKMVYEVRMGHLTIPMRVLTLDEENNIANMAIKETMSLGGTENDKNVKIEKATIRLATTIHHGGAPFVSDLLLNRMTADEHTYLYNEYVAIRERVNPNVEQIGQEEFRALVECLKKNAVSPKECSWRQLVATCTAFQEWIQRPDSPTSPTAS